jgi:hypothetical protein
VIVPFEKRKRPEWLGAVTEPRKTTLPDALMDGELPVMNSPPPGAGVCTAAMTAELPFVLRRTPPSAAKANWPESFIENEVTKERVEGTGAGRPVSVTGSKEKLCATTTVLREEKTRKTAAIVLNTISTPYGKWVFLFACLEIAWIKWPGKHKQEGLASRGIIM